MEIQGKLFQGQKNAKIAIIEKETQQFHFYRKENDVNRFYLKIPLWEIHWKKKQWSQFKVLRNPRKQVIRHGNSMKKKCYLEIHWIQFHYWKSQKTFSFKRNPPKRTSFTGKSRKLISPKEKSKKSTPTARIQRKLFLKTGKSKRRVFFARPWEQNMLIGKPCNKILMKILLKISFMVKHSVEIVFFDLKNFMETNLDDFKTIK